LGALFVSGCRFLRRTRLLRFVAPVKLPIAAGVIGTWVTSRRRVVLSQVAIGSKTAVRRVVLGSTGKTAKSPGPIL
jgi:hypothetical protein